MQYFRQLLVAAAAKKAANKGRARKIVYVRLPKMELWQFFERERLHQLAAAENAHIERHVQSGSCDWRAASRLVPCLNCMAGVYKVPPGHAADTNAASAAAAAAGGGADKTNVMFPPELVEEKNRLLADAFGLWTRRCEPRVWVCVQGSYAWRPLLPVTFQDSSRCAPACWLWGLLLCGHRYVCALAGVRPVRAREFGRHLYGGGGKVVRGGRAVLQCVLDKGRAAPRARRLQQHREVCREKSAAVLLCAARRASVVVTPPPPQAKRAGVRSIASRSLWRRRSRGVPRTRGGPWSGTTSGAVPACSRGTPTGAARARAAGCLRAVT